MASTTSNPEPEDWPGRTIDFVDYGRALADRRAAYEAAYGPIPVPRNTGARRTESKRALLEAVDAITEAQGWRW